MTASPIWVLGAGGQARETVELIAAIGSYRCSGVVDESDEADLLRGTTDALALGFGFPVVRAKVLDRFTGFAFPTLVHPRADVGPSTFLGAGVVVSSGCVITTDVTIGDGSLLNPRSGVGHESVLGRCCVVNPGANVSGSVTLGDGVQVGSGATILQGLRVGAGAVIGAGAVVTRDVEAGEIVVGVPARPHRRQEERTR